MARAIALMALTALGLIGGSSHEPFHADASRRTPIAVTERSGLAGCGGVRAEEDTVRRTVEQLLVLPNLAFLDQARRLTAPLARRQRRPLALGGPAAARRATCARRYRSTQLIRTGSTGATRGWLLRAQSTAPMQRHRLGRCRARARWP